MLAQRKDCKKHVPEFKVSRQNYENIIAKQIQADCKLVKLRKFRSNKIKVKSPKTKSRNKGILSKDYKSGPVNPKFLKMKLPISIDRNISNINKDKTQFYVNFKNIKNSEDLHDLNHEQTCNQILKLTKKLNSNPKKFIKKDDMPVSKAMMRRVSGKKSLKGFVTDNAVKINHIEYDNENNNAMLHRVVSLKDIDFHKVNEAVINESILNHQVVQAYSLKERKKEQR